MELLTLLQQMKMRGNMAVDVEMNRKTDSVVLDHIAFLMRYY
jgi:hypothetical protein